MKHLTFDQAIKRMKKFNKWNSGELDEWSKTDRVPPAIELRELRSACMNALQLCAHIGIENVDVTDPHVVVKCPTFVVSVFNDKEKADEFRKQDSLFYVPSSKKKGKKNGK